MKKICLLALLLATGVLPALSQMTSLRRGGQETVTERLTLTQEKGPQATTWHLDNLYGRFRIFSQPNIGTPGAEYLTIMTNGFMGMGLEKPTAPFHLAADNLYLQDRPGQFIIAGRTNPNLKMYMGVRTDLSVPVAQIAFVEEGIAWRNISLAPNGSNVGIGMVSPREKLEVNGSVRAYGAIMANSAVFDTGIQMEQERGGDRRPGWDRDRDRDRDRGYRSEDVILGLGMRHTRVFRVDDQGSVYAAKGFYPGGVDYAESVDVTGDRAGYQPGDVMAIDKTSADGFSLTREAYSTLVAGVYSTKPGVLASTHPLEMEKFESEVPLAMFGIVPCKVSAENGPIERGDLLVSASRPGFAMKGTDKKRMLGAIVGKALDPLPQGTGTIRVLLSSR